MAAVPASYADRLRALDDRCPWLTDPDADDNPARKKDTFNPKEPRDPNGKWSKIPGVGKGGKGGGGSGGGGGGSGGGDGGDGGGGKKGTLTDAEYEAHTKVIEARMGAALTDGKATDAEHAIDVDRGVWSTDRAKIHKEIVNDLYKKAADVPNQRKSVMAGGLGGAGKSTVLGKYAGIDSKQYLTLNPDDIKEVMAEKGLVPEVEGLSPMERAGLIHEESSHITNLLGKRALGDGKNVIWDITMASRGSVDRRITEMRGAGYDDMRAVFVDIPVETSVERALARHRRGMDQYNAGEGYGGRYVPPSIIRKNESKTSTSKNRDTFDAVKHEFDEWDLYDNSGTAPKLVSSSKGRLNTGS